MALVSSRKAAKAEAKKKERQRSNLGAVGAGAVILLLCGLYPKFAPKVEDSLRPSVREDAWFIPIVGNSGSEGGWGIKKQIAHETITLSAALGAREMNTLALRLGHEATEIYTGPNGEGPMVQVLQKHYLQAPIDKRPFTYLAPTLREVLRKVQNVSPNTLLIFAIGLDSADDTNQTRQMMEELAKRGHVLVIVHAIPVHEQRLREQTERWVAPLGTDAVVCSREDFPSTVNIWLPKKLREKGFQK